MSDPTCNFRPNLRDYCGKPATWEVDTSCACLNYRCGSCAQATRRVIAGASEQYGGSGRCKNCGELMRLDSPTWTPVGITPDVVNMLREAFAEARPCAAGGCTAVAEWLLVAPCGHDTAWCVNHHDITAETVARLVEQGTPYVCDNDDSAAWWADFRWEAAP